MCSNIDTTRQQHFPSEPTVLLLSPCAGDWELDTMCKTITKEDTLQIYVSDERPLCELNAAQLQQVVSQSNVKFKQITPAEVLALLAHLPIDDDQNYEFHHVQRAVVEFRAQRVNDCKGMYPSIMNSSPPKPRTRKLKATGA